MAFQFFFQKIRFQNAKFSYVYYFSNRKFLHTVNDYLLKFEIYVLKKKMKFYIMTNGKWKFVITLRTRNHQTDEHLGLSVVINLYGVRLNFGVLFFRWF